MPPATFPLRRMPAHLRLRRLRGPRRHSLRRAQHTGLTAMGGRKAIPEHVELQPLRNRHWRVITVTALAALLFQPLTATPQNEAPAQLSVQVDVVTVPVTVTD